MKFNAKLDQKFSNRANIKNFKSLKKIYYGLNLYKEIQNIDPRNFEKCTKIHN